MICQGTAASLGRSSRFCAATGWRLDLWASDFGVRVEGPESRIGARASAENLLTEISLSGACSDPRAPAATALDLV